MNNNEIVLKLSKKQAGLLYLLATLGLMSNIDEYDENITWMANVLLQDETLYESLREMMNPLVDIAIEAVEEIEISDNDIDISLN